MNELIRVCLVGAGRAARVHATSLIRRLSGAAVVAVVDVAEEAREALADEFGVPLRTATLEEALERTAFDAVVITTPTFTHRALAVTAAQAGKHVLVEKPMALTLAECDAMIAAAEAAGVALQLGYMRRFDPEFVTAWERIQAGAIGKPMMIKSLTHGPGLPPPWAWELARSNGRLAEVNSHDWDTVRWLMASNPTRIYVETANFKGPGLGVHAEHFYDNAISSIRFESGALGSISGICPCNYGYDARVEIVGEQGILQIGSLQGQAVVMCTDRDQGLLTPIYRTWPERFAEGYIREMEHFLSCIRDGAAPLVNGEDGRWAVACVMAGTRSLLEERPVRMEEIFAVSPA